MMMSVAQNDVLCEIMNIGVGKGAASLHGMVGHQVQLNVPTVQMLDEQELLENLLTLHGEKLSLVTMGFDGDIAGSASLLFPPESASILVTALTGSSVMEHEMDALRIGTLTEVGNIIVNSVIGTMGNMLGVSFTFLLPNFLEGTGADLMKYDQSGQSTYLVANTQMCVDDLNIKGAIVLIFSVGSCDEMLRLIDQAVSV